MQTSTENPAVEVESLYFEFNLGIPVFRDVSFDVPRGAVCGVLGRNGSGKSTLLQCLVGLLTAERGRCQLLGLDPAAATLELRRRVGYVPQSPQFDLARSAEEQLDFMRPFYDGRWNRQLEDELVEEFGLQLDLHKDVGQLSSGQQRQLSMVVALAFEPELLILDEPSVSLDLVVRRRLSERVVDFIASGDRTVMIASHMINEVERLVDQVVILDGLDVLVSAPLEELKTSLRCLEARLPRRAPDPDLQHDVVLQRRLGDTLRLAFWDHGSGGDVIRSLKEQRLESIREIEPSLEDVFVHLVGEGG